jgi:hypothetical protein
MQRTKQPGTQVGPVAHATLGASGAARWMNCPGSIALEAAVGEAYESEAARQGTAAHALAETALRERNSPLQYVGVTMEGVEVTTDMAEAVSVFTDYCERLRTHAGYSVGIEQQFNLDVLNPPAPMFGTADFWASYGYTLEIVDLKYGMGIVEANQNKQLLYYALGAVLATGMQPEKVKVTIIQPRAGHSDGAIRSFEVDMLELAEFANELLAAAHATQDPNAPRIPGTWCKWCKASGKCPEQHAAAMAVAQTDFAADILPDPEGLPDDVLFAMLPKVHLLENFLDAIQQRGESLMRQGVEIPGMKMVARRARRSWTDARKVEDWLNTQGPLLMSETHDTKLKSVAQIEKLVGAKYVPDELVQRVETGFKMVPATDPAPAVPMLSAQDEFTALPGETA